MADERLFYVKDDKERRFVGNGFLCDAIEMDRPRGTWFELIQPGLSFFDRGDQIDLFKIHLPYIWRTPQEVDTLFLATINRTTMGLAVLCGLVETDWYADTVNLVIRKPLGGQSIHVATGEPIAQAIFLPRSHCRASAKVLAPHARGRLAVFEPN